MAGIKTSDRKTGSFASAHDLRRSFGFRWAKRVMPAILQKMMRHANIQTTMEYYVVQGEAETADAVWEAVGCSPNMQNDMQSVQKGKKTLEAKGKGKRPGGCGYPPGLDRSVGV